jgi:thioredoxin 1
MIDPRADGSESIRTVAQATFRINVLEAAGPVAVEFMSYGCAHCRALEPVLQNVAHRVAPNEQIFRVNVALDRELARTYGIEGTPTLVMFRNAREVGRISGPSPTVASVLRAVTLPFA